MTLAQRHDLELAELEKERKRIAAFADRHGMRFDWHEPDEQDCTARVTGTQFDNAGFPEMELMVHLVCDDDELHVNLATLLAIATIGARRNK